MSGKPRFWIGTSWKMNKTLDEALSFAAKLKDFSRTPPQYIQRFVIPPFTAVRQVKALLSGTDVMVGAQNMHWAEQGPWTGEISASMLVDCNLDIVELGHSERREHFGETDETVGLKVEAAVRHGLVPLICVGETLAERSSGRASDVLKKQVSGALSKLSGEQRRSRILFAYEPVWAIGEGGTPATADYADARQAEIIAVTEAELGARIPCLYGGSVNPGNCEELIASPHIDGLFIGRSAWDAEGYINIITKCTAIISGKIEGETV
ncbi:triose-phosphate isomerase (plasmid) [Agrobacterium salinitolerans]|uniref:Triosephosphate isomerase n=1 Tax=Agrobacterium salinitolerans TaxID=1183413 RepID=A0A4Z1QU93_9HYPH|nr:MULTISPECIES: triose-phosphate isomerase [Agrobacterium]MDH6298090.1 triosephosphate isomerase [Agrobacterium fabrum]UYZ11093.1 triose-phosphate isomerase [Agrobacterium salinitolerans]